MFRTLHINGTSARVQEGEPVLPLTPGEKCWIDLQDFETTELGLVGQRFQFHSLALEDCVTPDQRAKVDEYGDHLFMVMHSLSRGEADGEEVIEAEEVDAFLGESYLVTVHRKPIKQLEAVWQRTITNGHLAAEGVDFLLYLILDALIDDAFPIIDAISDRLEEIEAEIIDRVEQSQLIRLLGLRRQLITIRRTLAPHRDVLAMLVRRGDPRISDKTALYFRDVYDHVVRAYEEIDTERDLLGNAMDAYISMTDNRTNNIMKQLTIFASIFLPLTFLTGFFGQNFTMLPIGSPFLYWAMLSVCVSVPIGMLVWFRWRAWL
jgi:magnesium transporter